MAAISRLGPGGYPRPPYGSFAGKQPGTPVPFGPRVTTTLTNKKAGPPGKHFTKKQKSDLLFDIYQEGLLAKEALKRFDGMSDFEKAEHELSEAEAAHDAALSAYDVTDTKAALSAAQDKVERLRLIEAKRRAKDDAKAKIKKQVADALAKIRKH